MKKAFYLLALLAVFTISCTPQKPNPENQTVMKPEKNDDGEWDLDVIDTQYDYFLNAIAKPMSMYTESYLKTRNQFLVSEWNSYYYSGRYRNVIESAIDYDPNENYGLKFEYKLYQVFAYVHWKYGLRMQGLSATDRR
ncbi:DUF6146 family protein [Chryseobacterium taklimakanense]|uniref:Uncharacterized protein n=1 Tax=Chryseobacterium taklimakanense TaxID=536441 RepID=A0A3G8WP27_9FLAO|nr:DUF6146 family protein [Chryseobacterium taklimakanense]AZI21247.1 hypothetical protein EIH08_11580 [Chryseobacterium taklimakanense]MCG7281411.1 DUF6146 family protein [Chryseobacterium taklimakanense]